MPSVPYSEAALLSYCSVIPPRFDALVTDQVLARLPIRTLATQCEKRAVVTEADKPAIVYIDSGGTLNSTPVEWDAPSSFADLTPKRIGSWIQINGDIKDNLSQAASIVDAQARLLAELIKQKVGEQLWAASLDADSPPGMAAFADENPNGVLDGNEQRLSLDQLGCLRNKLSPWSPSTPLAYVMNSKTFEWLESTARNEGAPIVYHRNDRTGVVAPYWGSFEVLVCDWISQEETTSPTTTSVYMIRLGTAADDPPGIEGVSIVTPHGEPLIQVTPLLPTDTGDDVWQSCVYADVAFDPGSRGGAVARLNNVLTV